MSHADDLALVTACRDAVARAPSGPWVVSTSGWTVWGRGNGDMTWSIANASGPVTANLIATLPDVYGVTLGLVEDAFKDHAPGPDGERRLCQSLCATVLGPDSHICQEWPCTSYHRTRTALLEVAGALGVKP